MKGSLPGFGVMLALLLLFNTVLQAVGGVGQGPALAAARYMMPVVALFMFSVSINMVVLVAAIFLFLVVGFVRTRSLRRTAMEFTGHLPRVGIATGAVIGLAFGAGMAQEPDRSNADSPPSLSDATDVSERPERNLLDDLAAAGAHVTGSAEAPSASPSGAGPVSSAAPERSNLCGSPTALPGGIAPERWARYRCRSKAQVGSGWGACLRRADYAATAGSGCPGDQRCCPP